MPSTQKHQSSGSRNSESMTEMDIRCCVRGVRMAQQVLFGRLMEMDVGRALEATATGATSINTRMSKPTFESVSRRCTAI